MRPAGLLQAALEVLAVLDIVELPGGVEQQEALRRMGAMLARSARLGAQPL